MNLCVQEREDTWTNTTATCTTGVTGAESGTCHARMDCGSMSVSKYVTGQKMCPSVLTPLQRQNPLQSQPPPPQHRSQLRSQHRSQPQLRLQLLLLNLQLNRARTNGNTVQACPLFARKKTSLQFTVAKVVVAV